MLPPWNYYSLLTLIFKFALIISENRSESSQLFSFLLILSPISLQVIIPFFFLSSSLPHACRSPRTGAICCFPSHCHHLLTYYFTPRWRQWLISIAGQSQEPETSSASHICDRGPSTWAISPCFFSAC